jgi:hypothetical protein
MLLLFFFVFITAQETREGEALRFCRELNYAPVITRRASEELRVATNSLHAIDQQLVNHYHELSKDAHITQTCLFHWKNLYCSFAFAQTVDALPCPLLCECVVQYCKLDASTICQRQSRAINETQCTNYGELTGFCAAESNSKKQVPLLPHPIQPTRRGEAPRITLTPTVAILLTSLCTIYLCIKRGN